MNQTLTATASASGGGMRSIRFRAKALVHQADGTCRLEMVDGQLYVGNDGKLRAQTRDRRYLVSLTRA